MHVLAAAFLLLGVVAAEEWRHGIVSGAVNQPLCCRRNLELHGVGFAVVLGNASGIAAEKIHDRVVAEMKIPRLLQVHHSRKRDYPLDGGLMTGQAQGQLASGGVAHHDRFVRSRL